MPARDSKGRFIKRSQTDSEPRNDGAYWTRPTPLAMPRQRVVHTVKFTPAEIIAQRIAARNTGAAYTTSTGDR